MPLFGKDSKLKSGLPVPHALLHDAISTRDVPAQIRFSKSLYKIQKLISESKIPKLFERLINIQKNQLQHKILLCAEKIKIDLSDLNSTTARLDFIEKDLILTCNHSEFLQAIERQIQDVLNVSSKAVNTASLSPSKVFVTGGMSKSSELLNALSEYFDDKAPVIPMNSLTAVGLGLGFVADSISTNSSSNKIKLENLSLES